MTTHNDVPERSTDEPINGVLSSDSLASDEERRTALARGEARCVICRRSADSSNVGAITWAVVNPAICTACVASAVEKVQSNPAIAMRVVGHLGGVHSARCDGDGVLDMTREHSGTCDGYLYPDDMCIEARYALSGTIEDNPAAVVTMRYCLACFARFHVLPDVSIEGEGSPEQPGLE